MILKIIKTLILLKSAYLALVDTAFTIFEFVNTCFLYLVPHKFNIIIFLDKTINFRFIPYYEHPSDLQAYIFPTLN